MRRRRIRAFMSVRYVMWRPIYIVNSGAQPLYFGALSNPVFWGNDRLLCSMRPEDFRHASGH